MKIEINEYECIFDDFNDVIDNINLKNIKKIVITNGSKNDWVAMDESELSFNDNLNLENLEYIEIYDIYLKEFPNFLYECNKIKEIHIVDCNLKNIDYAKINKLLNLETLNLGYNSFNEIDDTIFYTPNLKTLILTSNIISYINENIDNHENYKLEITKLLNQTKPVN